MPVWLPTTPPKTRWAAEEGSVAGGGGEYDDDEYDDDEYDDD